MILITGADGAVGSYAEEVFAGERLHLGTLETLDVTDPDKVLTLCRELRPAAVVHLASETDVDRCEKERAHAFRVNADGAANVAAACRETGAVMAYVSTGMVFDGSKDEPYVESDPVAPGNVYAESKLAGEEAVRRELERFFIVRTSWLIGGGKRDKKFVAKILRLLGERDRIEVVSDLYGTLTYGRQLLLQIKALLATEHYGVFHAANPGKVSRFDIAQEIVRLIGSSAEVVPVGAERFPLPAPRGKSEVLSVAKLEALGLCRMTDWRRALAEYLEELKRIGRWE
ncbi:MAG: dTDP-4-dehydrorhamnose reductase [Elusimicrobiota bacterium]